MRILLLIIALLLPVSGWAATYPLIEHHDTFRGPNASYYYMLHGTDGTYLYGSQGPTIFRTVAGSQATTTLLSDVSVLIPGATIYRIIPSKVTPGTILLILADSSVYKVYRTTNGGANNLASDWTMVLTLGASNGSGGADSTNVRVLGTDFEMGVNYPGQTTGRGDWIIGEYNVNTSRVSGGTNDRVRILRSQDGGATWNTLVQWNTDGTNKVGHIHNVKQDPYTGYVYVATGDENSKSAIIRWDGVTSWADNIAFSSLDTVGDAFKISYGTQACRTVGLIFSANNVFTMSDTTAFSDGTGASSGIWKRSKDLSVAVRVDSQIWGAVGTANAQHIGWFGENVNGALVFFTGIEGIDATYTWTTNTLKIYASYDGDNWAPVARIGTSSAYPSPALHAPAAVFQLNGKLYFNYWQGAGYGGQVVLSVGGSFSGTAPETVHPVYYVGTWLGAGSDGAGYGRCKAYPFATPNYALTGSRITYGARVRISPGTYTANITPVWKANSAPGNPADSVIVEGESRDTTVLRSSAAAGSVTLYLSNSDTSASPTVPIIIKRLHIWSQGDGVGGVNHGSNTIYALDAVGMNIESCKIGHENNDDSQLIVLRSGSTIRVNKTILQANPLVNTAYGDIVAYSGIGACSVYINSSILLAGYRAVTPYVNGSIVQLFNNIFIGYKYRAVEYSGTDVSLVAKNNIFSGATGSRPLADLTAHTETAVDYNLYSHTNVSVTDGGHSLPVGSDPRLTPDYRLKSGSPCIKAGTPISGLTTDFAGKNWKNPPSIGAYEYYRKGGNGWGQYNFGFGW